MSLILCDTLLTRDEYHAIADGRADSDAPSTGSIAITDWIAEHRTELGCKYANELDRHFRPCTLDHHAKPLHDLFMHAVTGILIHWGHGT